jgi:hypothetical protein
MGKSLKRTKRGDHYQTMAAGFQILKSPLAASYNAAAEHYRQSDPPLDPPAGRDTAGRDTSGWDTSGSDTSAAQGVEPWNGRD